MWQSWLATYVISFINWRWWHPDPTERSMRVQCVYVYVSGKRVPTLCDFSWAPEELMVALACLRGKVARQRLLGSYTYSELYKCMEGVPGWKEYIAWRANFL